MEFGVKSNVINLRHFKSKSMDYASIPRKRGTLNPLLTYYIRSPATIAGRVWADAQGLIFSFFLKLTTLGFCPEPHKKNNYLSNYVLNMGCVASVNYTKNKMRLRSHFIFNIYSFLLSNFLVSSVR